MSLSRRTLPLAALLPVLACSAPPPTVFSELGAESAAVYAGYIRPTSDESRWREIEWLPNFADGMRTAGREGRPLLFWAMNGHPLGCT